MRHILGFDIAKDKSVYCFIDELIEFDMNQKEIEEVIKNTYEEKESRINWTKAWGKKYPILVTWL